MPSIVGAVQHPIEQARHSFKRWRLGCGSQLWPAISTQAATLMAALHRSPQARERREGELACVLQ
jgi:hypothetical protein